jgi:hypothetical protein
LEINHLATLARRQIRKNNAVAMVASTPTYDVLTVFDIRREKKNYFFLKPSLYIMGK